MKQAGSITPLKALRPLSVGAKVTVASCDRAQLQAAAITGVQHNGMRADPVPGLRAQRGQGQQHRQDGGPPGGERLAVQG